MCSSYGYKALPYAQGFIAICELALGIVRIVIYFSPKSAIPPSTPFGTSSSANGTISSPLPSSSQATAAFALDWIASIVATFMGVYIAIFGVIAAVGGCLACSYACLTANKGSTDISGFKTCCGLLCDLCLSKPNHRCVTLTCNCPFYKARPRARFIVRAIVQAVFLLFRVIAIILYATAKNVSVYGAEMAVICTASVGLLVLSMGFDLYQYRTWWHYKPDGIHKHFRCLCCRQKFHKAHQRFLPQPLLGQYRDPTKLGDDLCDFTVAGSCPDRTLEHIVSFHAFDFKPQKRYQPNVDKTYIGFHRTKTEYAILIAQNGFKPSMTPPQMLGFGVYFARSFEDTAGKARQEGAYIVAEIEMRKVRVITRDEMDQVRNSNAWWEQYDTIYLNNTEENRDEFVIKDPEQILKWVMVMNDTRLYRYGLDTEFENTRFGCI